MLSGIKIVSKEEAERLGEKRRKKHSKRSSHNKEKKKHDKKHKKLDTYSSGNGSSGGSQQEDGRTPVSKVPAKSRDEQVGLCVDVVGAREPVHDDEQTQQHREDWMTLPMARSSLDTIAKAKCPEEATGQQSTVDLARTEDKNSGNTTHGKPPIQLGPATVVGDGGASWRMKALRRAQAQAEEQGRHLAEVVSERWGSLGNLATELTANEEKLKKTHSMAHLHAARDRRRRFNNEGGTERPHVSDVKSLRGQMKRPSDPNFERSMSWKDMKKVSKNQETRGDQNTGEREVLTAVALQLNVFANDGSFLEKFSARGHDDTIPNEIHHNDGGKKKELFMHPNEQPPQQRHIEKEIEPILKSHEGSTKKFESNNTSAAAALRARLTGHKQNNVERETKSANGDDEEEERVVVLPLVGVDGKAVPGAFGRESAVDVKGASGKPIKRVERYQDGERKRYFADDDSLDLDTLVKRTKYREDDDMDTIMARNIARKSNFKEVDVDADAEYDWDGGIDLVDGRYRASKQARRRGNVTEEIAMKEKQRQVREYTKFQSAVDRCTLCFASQARQKHLTVAIGTAAYLALPTRGRLVPGHCQILPIDHIASTRVSDEITWNEIRNFKKCLLQMYNAQGKGVLFIETSLDSNTPRAHAVVDCIPVPPEALSKASMYFKKAVDDATPEWSQYAAKKMIDTTSKGLKGCIPPNFPYFFVEFGLLDGFVHVVDNVEEFDRDLGRNVVIGLLRLPEEEMHRQAKKESFGIQSQWAAELRTQFDPYDWTKELQ